MCEEADWAAEHAYILIGNVLLRQITTPQGGHMSPPTAIAHSMMLVHLKYLRLESQFHAALHTNPTRATKIRDVISLLQNCVCQYMDDVACHFPYLRNHPYTLEVATLALSEVHDTIPLLSGTATFPSPLQLIREVDGP